MRRTPEFYRMLAGLNLRQLSDRSGVSHTSISNLEKGDIKKPGAVTLEKIGLALIDAIDERKKLLGTRYEKLSLEKFIESVLETRDARMREKREAAAAKVGA